MSFPAGVKREWLTVNVDSKESRILASLALISSPVQNLILVSVSLGMRCSISWRFRAESWVPSERRAVRR